jgi:hypothetical protein
MSSRWQEMGEGFWNLRGSFRIGGVVDIGTHCSLARLSSGRWLFLDACPLDDEAAAQVDRITGGGEALEAVLNLHPFHTVYVPALHERYPNLALHGTARHQRQLPDLPWQQERCEDEALQQRYASDLAFTIPRGVDFISANEQIHFSSVLALHRASQAIHVDDTLMCLRMPLPLRWLGVRELVSFHPTLAFALEKRAGAAADFRQWAEGLIAEWGDAQVLCAAHNSCLQTADLGPQGLRPLLRRALQKMNGTLRSHERQWG